MTEDIRRIYRDLPQMCNKNLNDSIKNGLKTQRPLTKEEKLSFI